MIGTILAYAAATAFISLGLGALAAPKASSLQYGLATEDEDALAYVRALGVRDLVLGLALFAFSLAREGNAAAIVAELGALIGFSDFLIVASRRGNAARRNLVIHGAGTIGLLGVWIAIRLGS